MGLASSAFGVAGSNQMSIGRSVLLVLVCLVAAATAPSRASATGVGSAVQHIEVLGKQALSTLRQSGMTLAQREHAFAKLLRDGFDLPLIARFVLGKYWRKADDEQRRDYLDAFSDYVIKSYARRMGGFEGQSFSVTGTQVSGEKKDVFVNTRINQTSGPPIEAAWRVREIDGKNKIIDIVVEGVSMVVTQRQEFASVVRRNGIEGLIHVLRAKTERLSATAG